MRCSSRRSGGIVVISTVVLVGCVADAVYAPPPVTDPTKLYWSLALDHRAITMSLEPPYDTIQLTALPLTIQGRPISGLPAPTFTSLDLDHVQVSAQGLVHAIATGTQNVVVASLTTGNDTHVDTVYIDVTDSATYPVLSTFTIHPDVGDSAKTAVGFGTTIQWRASDPGGNPIGDLSVYYAASDSTYATIDRSGFLRPIRPGKLKVYATATAYGVTKADTLPYTLGFPISANTQITATTNSTGQRILVFVPDKMVAGPGAVVLFGNESKQLVGVTFDNPTNVDSVTTASEYYLYCSYFAILCGSGNIPPFGVTPSDTSDISKMVAALRLREFPVPGTYTFHSTVSGATGQITIMNQ